MDLMEGMGYYFAFAIVACIAIACLVPLLIVAMFPGARRRPWAWLAAATPLLLIVALAGHGWRIASLGVALAEAAGRGDNSEVSRLVAMGASPDATDDYETPAIHNAIENCQWDTVKLLIDLGATNTPRFWKFKDDTAATRLREAGRNSLAELVAKRPAPE